MSKVEQRPVIGIVPKQVPDEDIVRVYGPDGLVESIEVRDRTFMCFRQDRSFMDGTQNFQAWHCKFSCSARHAA